MRTRLSGGVAGVEGETLPPYADHETSIPLPLATRSKREE